ncbi:unnamed protein product [Spirodela intermedia]|uniref:NAC domain-containing protein n=1 Tax=Spirodela intermedia TaxID=51605 RepID=A0A7I8L3C7_SPIIN|nr:unnamed protein product [Spirodela intermedia]
MPMTTLPPGFRFHPTDVELVCYYLKRKIMGKPIHFEAISEIELYKFAPWDLPGKSCLRGRDLEWYFFCVGEKKYSNGLRKNRATTEVGYWKTTGKDKPISYNSRTIAMKKTLVFHEAKVQDGRTDWVMHEYRLEDVALAGAGFLQDAYVLCKIFKKSGRGPKIGEQYGAPFDETEWDDTKADDCSLLLPSLQGGTIMSTLHQPDPLPLDLDSCAVDSSPLSSTLDQWVHPNEVNEISTVENAQAGYSQKKKKKTCFSFLATSTPPSPSLHLNLDFEIPLLGGQPTNCTRRSSCRDSRHRGASKSTPAAPSGRHPSPQQYTSS